MQDVQYFSKIQYLLKATETLRPEGEGASPMGMLCWMGGGGGQLRKHVTGNLSCVWQIASEDCFYCLVAGR